MSRTRCSSCNRLTEREEGSACLLCEQEVEENLINLGGVHGLYAVVISMGPSILYPVSAGRSERAPSKVEAPLPINSAAVDLTSASGGVVTTLRVWANRWHSDPMRGFQPVAWPTPLLSVQTASAELIRGQLDTAIDALLASLSWATEYRVDFRDFRKDVDRMVMGCRRLIDPTDPGTKPVPHVYLGRCPGPDDSDVGCEQKLEIRVGATSIRCPVCTTVWPMRRWPQLAARVRR